MQNKFCKVSDSWTSIFDIIEVNHTPPTQKKKQSCSPPFFLNASVITYHYQLLSFLPQKSEMQRNERVCIIMGPPPPSFAPETSSRQVPGRGCLWILIDANRCKFYVRKALAFTRILIRLRIKALNGVVSLSSACRENKRISLRIYYYCYFQFRFYLRGCLTWFLKSVDWAAYFSIISVFVTASCKL